VCQTSRAKFTCRRLTARVRFMRQLGLVFCASLELDEKTNYNNRRQKMVRENSGNGYQVKTNMAR